jgi:hypothetical protein
MMDESLRAQRDASVTLIDRLIRRGRELSGELTAAAERPAPGPAPASDAGPVAAVAMSVRLWQHDCAAAINELSGGSKAHWLARAFSRAFLVPSTDAAVIVEAGELDIVHRLLDVLLRARASLAGIDGAESGAAASVRRFDFVHNEALRPVLEQAYRESGAFLEQGLFELALITSCGILEAIVTDALENLATRATGEGPRGGENIADWSFEKRIEQAEQAGLIRGGCARLPPVARKYRDGGGGAGGSAVRTSERDARLARQVLHVIMKDLDPGR